MILPRQVPIAQLDHAQLGGVRQRHDDEADGDADNDGHFRRIAPIERIFVEDLVISVV